MIFQCKENYVNSAIYTRTVYYIGFDALPVKNNHVMETMLVK